MTRVRLLAHSLPLILTASLLAACSSPPRHERGGGERRIDARTEALRAGAYRPAQEAGLSVSLQRWVVRGDNLPVSLAFPAGSDKGLPLIVYLPGLGESAQAAQAWRHAWARAGYAVLSLQALDADERAWSSEQARNADFRALARERREPAQAAARLLVVQAVLDEARRRATAGDALWQRVDFERLGLAGYELGAQAALAVPGARARLVIAPQTVGEPAHDGSPLLLVASRRDSDPLTGEPMAPRARELFEMRSGETDRLMMFDAASHAALGGAGSEKQAMEQPPQQQQSGERQSRGGGGGKRGGGGGGGPGGGHQRGGGMGGGAEGMGGGPQQGGMRDGMERDTDSGSTALAIEAASTAFWDATLRASPPARAWLNQDAGPWLRGLADWQSTALKIRAP